MVYETIAFALFALVTVGSSLGVVLVQDVWHSALFLGGALLSVAVFFVMARAEFVAAMQVLVYVGGVLILLSFAVMLLREDTPRGESEARESTEEGEPA
jgi:NADH-quinone oxidoreductase subunit J